MERKRYLFAIFAHPDDEAFGPSGTLYRYAHDGWQVHIICVTDGAANAEAASTETRINELLHACELIGATDHILNYKDGTLSNRDYQTIAETVKELVTSAVDEKDSIVDFMTFEPHGITGHIDHIVVSYITTHLFTNWDKWASSHMERGQLRYFCLCDAQKAEEPDYFVYSPKGYPEEEVDETVSVADVLEEKKAIIQAHASQHDYKLALARGDHLLSNEHFLLYKN